MAKESDMAAVERRTICFPHQGTQNVLQFGQHGFQGELNRLYTIAENNALERVIELKEALRLLSTDDFWGAVTQGMSTILGAEYCFVMKRILVDDQDSAVEMPPHGEPGSCMMAAMHYCASDGTKDLIRSRFHAYGCPCAYMRHDKVFVIPDHLGDFITNNPNKLPMPCEAYIALPLIEDGKCFAHFGAMWSVEGAKKRQLSWAFIEMMLHTLEDMISRRFMEGADFVRPSSALLPEKKHVIPHEAITVAQSLRPYAGSLSHELRTPMQGIVGMLDVMYATVREAAEIQSDPKIRKIFQTLKDNIEIVQDSSRRAVEAADNIVHAYDMDMSIPDAPPYLLDDPSDYQSPFSSVAERRPQILVAGSNLPLARPNKRRRDEPTRVSDLGTNKKSRVAKTPPCRCSEPDMEQGVQLAEDVLLQSGLERPEDETSLAAGAAIRAHRIIAPGLRHTNLSELVQYVINEALKVGGRPDSAMAQETDAGEIIEVRTRGSDGSIGQKIIEWRVDPSVPTTLFIDEKDLSKLISCIFLNAIKFTDKNDGRVKLDARMSSRGRYISIKLSDNGPGIPAAFLPRLFKPFSQENASITRSSDGLGLGLLVAKGIARKLGGDLMCTKAETSGENHGTDFEIKIPVQAGETISRPGSPFGSPVPRRPGPNTVVDSPHIKPLPAMPGSPHNLSRALHEVVSEGSFFKTASNHLLSSTPGSPKSTTTGSEPSPPPSFPSPPTEPVRVLKPRPRFKKSVSNPEIDRNLASKYPLTFLVAEDNKINRKLLVSMLSKFGYQRIHEAHDGAEAVRQMTVSRQGPERVDVVLMDLWMPLMDGYEATERILGMKHWDSGEGLNGAAPTVLAVTADVTDDALQRAAEVGMKGFMTKPYKLLDLQRLITEYCASHKATTETPPTITNGQV